MIRKIVLIITFLTLLCYPYTAVTADQTTDSTPTVAEVTALIALMNTGDTLTFSGKVRI